MPTRRVIDAVVLALLEGAQLPDRRPGLADRLQDAAVVVAVGGAGLGVGLPVARIAGVRVVAAGAREAVEVLGVRAAAEAHGLARVVGGELGLEQRLERGVDRRRQDVGAQLGERGVAHRRLVAEVGIGEQRPHAIVEAVLLHELVVVEDRDPERLARRHAGRVAQDRVAGGLGAERGDRRLDRRRHRHRGVLEHDVLDVAQIGDGQVHRRHLPRRGLVRLPPGVGLVGGDLGERVLERSRRSGAPTCPRARAAPGW